MYLTCTINTISMYPLYLYMEQLLIPFASLYTCDYRLISNFQNNNDFYDQLDEEVEALHLEFGTSHIDAQLNKSTPAQTDYLGINAEEHYTFQSRGNTIVVIEIKILCFYIQLLQSIIR